MSKRPNILFIMSDDHAANAISAYGSRLAEHAPTPNIDRIAKEGVRLDNCFCTNAICTPSRATILTGQHSHNCGVRTLSDTLPNSAVLLPELLEEAGYRTGLFGKWHLGVRPRGFQDWAVIPGQGIYHDPFFVYPDEEATRGTILRDLSQGETYCAGEMEEYSFGPITRESGYVTDLITDKTLAWLDAQDENTPFFLCCQHKAPHDFFEYRHDHEGLFDGVNFHEPETLFEDERTKAEISRRFGTTVSERWPERNMIKHLKDSLYPNGGPVDFSGLDENGRIRKAYQKYMEDYLRTVHAIDLGVGRILDTLERKGLSDNTLIIYTSDQGLMLGEHDHIDKRWIFDESQRMPFVARLPKEIPAGTVSRDVADNVDFAQTMLDYAGVPAPGHMEGRSLRGVLRGDTPTNWRQSTYYRYWMHMAHHGVPAHYGIRTDRYKLIFFYGLKLDATGCMEPICDIPTPAGYELYDLKADPLETKNVCRDPAYRKVREILKKELHRLKQEYGDTDEAYPELLALVESTK